MSPSPVWSPQAGQQVEFTAAGRELIGADLLANITGPMRVVDLTPTISDEPRARVAYTGWGWLLASEFRASHIAPVPVHASTPATVVAEHVGVPEAPVSVEEEAALDAARHEGSDHVGALEAAVSLEEAAQLDAEHVGHHEAQPAPSLEDLTRSVAAPAWPAFPAAPASVWDAPTPVFPPVPSDVVDDVEEQGDGAYPER